MNEPIHVIDFRPAPGIVTGAYPEECRESFGNIARSLVRRWSAGNARGEWGEIEQYPVLCREWLRYATAEQMITHNNEQICQSAIWCLMLGGSIALDKFTDFLADWLWRGETLR